MALRLCLESEINFRENEVPTLDERKNFVI